MLETHEVNDVRPDWLLSAELHAFALPVSQCSQ
jgi:hypothetical protein